MRPRGAFWALLALSLGCSRAGSEPQPAPSNGPPVAATTDRASASAAPQAEADAAPAPPAASAAPEPAPAASAPVYAELEVPGDRPAYVAHAAPGVRRAIVYLHGVCGDVFAPRSWLESATRAGTLIALVGEKPCGERRRSWTATTEQLHRRIGLALTAVARARSGALDESRVILMGYSQGASRAELLAAKFPDVYPWLVLGGAPSEPSPRKLQATRRVAVLGGERDVTTHLVKGVRDLEKAGKSAQFFELPGAGHGEYGPQGPAVMARVFDWITEDGE